MLCTSMIWFPQGTYFFSSMRVAFMYSNYYHCVVTFFYDFEMVVVGLLNCGMALRVL